MVPCTGESPPMGLHRRKPSTRQVALNGHSASELQNVAAVLALYLSNNAFTHAQGKYTI
jgi:hypothetical protein